MLGFQLPLTLLELLSLSLVTLSGITLGHEGTGVKVSVKEGSDVILPCSLDNKQDITAAVFDWKKVAQKDEPQKGIFFYDAGIHYNNGRTGQSEQFRGRVSHFEDQLKHGNASIIIRNTKTADSGNYICFFPVLQPRQTFYIQLDVVAAPTPFIRTLHATDDWSLLQCEVRGASPKPEIEWQDHVGNKLPAEEPQVSERGGSYDITLKITVTKTDRYRCVVEQGDIKHRVTSETFVHISERVCKDWIGWLGGFILVFSILAVQALLVLRKCITIRCNNGPRQQGNDSVHQGNDSVHQGNDSVHLGNGSVHLGRGLVNRENGQCEDPSGLLPRLADAS